MSYCWGIFLGAHYLILKIWKNWVLQREYKIMGKDKKIIALDLEGAKVNIISMTKGLREFGRWLLGNAAHQSI